MRELGIRLSDGYKALVHWADTPVIRIPLIIYYFTTGIGLCNILWWSQCLLLKLLLVIAFGTAGENKSGGNEQK